MLQGSLQLLAGEIVVHQAAVAEGQLQHAAFAAEFIFADGIEFEFHGIPIVVDGFGPKIAVLQIDLIDDEIKVLGMLVLAAETIPFRLVDTFECNILNRHDGLRFLIPLTSL